MSPCTGRASRHFAPSARPGRGFLRGPHLSGFRGPASSAPVDTDIEFGSIGQPGRRTRGRADVRRVRDAAPARAESPHLDAGLSRRLCRQPRAADGAAGRVAAVADGRGPQTGTPRPRSQTRRRPPRLLGSRTPAGTIPMTALPSPESGGPRPVPACLSARPFHLIRRSGARRGMARNPPPAGAPPALPDVLPSVLPALRPCVAAFSAPAAVRTGTESVAAPRCFRFDARQRSAGRAPASPVLRFHPPHAAAKPPEGCACGLSDHCSAQCACPIELLRQAEHAAHGASTCHNST